MKLTCPTENRLREFLEGTVSDAEAEQISVHVEDCASCELVLSRLESSQDPVLARLRDGLRIERFLNEPELCRLRNTADLSLTDTSAEPEAEEHFARGKRLRDYRLVRKIGEGGMGTVYQAVHVHLGKSVALKILPTDKLRSKNSVSRFRQEMRAVGSVSHPNVVSASDAGTVDGQHFLVMELVEGADLARIIHGRGPLSVADACKIIHQAAIGLQHAHDNGLVHRDVKPSNLMLATDGTVKVLDLGLAGLNNTEFESTANVVVGDRLTSVGQIMGTLDYMAPEQITASTRVDGRADIYALGATLFQLLTKRTPCGDRSADTPERIEAVLHQPPLDIATFRTDVPEGLRVLLREMLAKSPQDRPQSASDLASELSRFTADADLVALAEECKTSLDMPSADVDVTDDVSFVVARSESQPKVDSIRLPNRIRRNRSILAFAAAVLLLVTLAVYSAITFRTEHGTVEVTFPNGVNAADVRLALDKDGKTVRVMEMSGRWTVDIEAGRYDMRLLSGDEQFELVAGVLTVKSGQTSIVQIRQIPRHTTTPPNIEEIFRRGQYEQAAELAEREASRNPDDRPNHGRAAVMWLYVGLQDRDNERARERFEYHRNWLADRWSKTGEAPRTIPRICCMQANPPGDLGRMVAAIIEEADRYPQEAWQYAHSRMVVLYRLRHYEKALEALQECRRLAPRDPMRVAVDHLWSAMILHNMGQIAAGIGDLQMALQLIHEDRPQDGRAISSKLFDFVESHAALEEASRMTWEMTEPPTQVEASTPYSLCVDDFRLSKWRSSSDPITSAALSADGKVAVLGLGWRPGTWEWWKVDDFDEESLCVSDNEVVRRQGGQPIRSVAIHPFMEIAALGRWYGAVDVVHLADGKILATYETSIGKLRKANSVRFSEGGRNLLIGYQSNRLVDWIWRDDKVSAQHTFPQPVWKVFETQGGNIGVGGQLWNRHTGATRTLVEGATISALSPDGNIAIVRRGPHLQLFDVRRNEVAGTLEFESEATNVVPFWEANHLITGHKNGEIRCHDILTRESILLGSLHQNHGVEQMEVDASGRYLLTATGKRINRGQANDHQIAIWRLSDGLLSKSKAALTSSADHVDGRRRQVRQQIHRELVQASGTAR